MPHEGNLTHSTYTGRLDRKIVKYLSYHRIKIVRLVNTKSLCGVLSCQVFLGFLPPEQLYAMSANATESGKALWPDLVGSVEDFKKTLKTQEKRNPCGTPVVELITREVMSGRIVKGQFQGQYSSEILFSAFSDVQKECQEKNIKFYSVPMPLCNILYDFGRRRRSSVFMADSFAVRSCLRSLEQVDYFVVCLIHLDTSLGGHAVVTVHPPRAKHWMVQCNSEVRLFTAEDVDGDLNYLTATENVAVVSATVTAVLFSVSSSWKKQKEEEDLEKAVKVIKRKESGAKVDFPIVKTNEQHVDEERDREQPKEAQRTPDGQPLPKPVLNIHDITITEEGKGIRVIWITAEGAAKKKWFLTKMAEGVFECVGGRGCKRRGFTYQGNPFTEEGKKWLKRYIGTWHADGRCAKNPQAGGQSKSL